MLIMLINIVYFYYDIFILKKSKEPSMKEYKMIQMEKELHQELKEYCKKHGYRISGLVESLVKQKLDSFDKMNVKVDPSKVLHVEPKKHKYN